MHKYGSKTVRFIVSMATVARMSTILQSLVFHIMTNLHAEFQPDPISSFWEKKTHRQNLIIDIWICPSGTLLPSKNWVPQVKFLVSFHKSNVYNPNNSKWASEKFNTFLHRKSVKWPDYKKRATSYAFSLRSPQKQYRTKTHQDLTYLAFNGFFLLFVCFWY